MAPKENIPEPAPIQIEIEQIIYFLDDLDGRENWDHELEIEKALGILHPDFSLAIRDAVDHQV